MRSQASAQIINEKLSRCNIFYIYLLYKMQMEHEVTQKRLNTKRKYLEISKEGSRFVTLLASSEISSKNSDLRQKKCVASVNSWQTTFWN
jgi:hypothetical protein